LIFPKLKENAAIFPNSKGGVVVQKGKKNHCTDCQSLPKDQCHFNMGLLLVYMHEFMDNDFPKLLIFL
jgi:hypothetical protein